MSRLALSCAVAAVAVGIAGQLMGGGEPSLHELAFRGLEEEMEARLDNGTGVGERDSHGNTALHFAAKAGNGGTVGLLLRRGADPNARNGGGSSPLLWGTYDEGRGADTVRQLVGGGADVGAANEHGETALHWAAEWLRPAAVETLLELGAEPDALDSEGNSALHRLPPRCHTSDPCVRVVEALVRSGADVTARNAAGTLPLAEFDYAGALEKLDKEEEGGDEEETEDVSDEENDEQEEEDETQ